MPDLDRVIPVLLEHGLERLPEHCRLSPGTSPGPRAGQPQPHPVHRWLRLQKPGSGLLQAPCLLAWASPLLVAVGSPLLGHLRAPLSPRVESYSRAQTHSHSPWSLPPLRRGPNEACYSRCPKRQWGRLDRICPSHTRVLRRAGGQGGRSALLQGSPGDLGSCCLVSLSSQGCHPNVHNHSLYLFSTLRVKGEGTTRLLVRMSPRPCTWHCRMQVAVSAMSSPLLPSFLTHPLPHPRGPPEANVGPPNPGCQRGPEAL